MKTVVIKYALENDLFDTQERYASIPEDARFLGAYVQRDVPSEGVYVQYSAESGGSVVNLFKNPDALGTGAVALIRRVNGSVVVGRVVNHYRSDPPSSVHRSARAVPEGL